MNFFLRILLLNLSVFQSACGLAPTKNLSSEHESRLTEKIRKIDHKALIQSGPILTVERQEICHLIKGSLFNGVALKKEVFKGESISEIKWPPFDAEVVQYPGRLIKNTCHLETRLDFDIDGDGVDELVEKDRGCIGEIMSEGLSIYISSVAAEEDDVRFKLFWSWENGAAGFMRIDDDISTQSRQLEQYETVNLRLPIEVSIYKFSESQYPPLLRVSTKFGDGKYLGHLFSFFDRKKNGKFGLKQVCFFDGEE